MIDREDDSSDSAETSSSDTKTRKRRVQKAAETMFEVICAALIGVDVIALVQLATLTYLDEYLTDAVYSFAISIPLLTFFVLSVRMEKTREVSISIWYKDIALFLGIIGTPVGVGCLIAHLSLRAGTIFGLLCAVVMLLVMIHVAIADNKARLD
jgi:hypothetical protein